MIPFLLLLFLFLLFSILIFNFSLRRRTELCRFLDILPPSSFCFLGLGFVCLFVSVFLFFGLIFCFCGWVLLFVFEVARCCYSFLWRRGLLQLFFSLPTPISLDSSFLCTQAASQAPRPVLSLSLSLSLICLARALVLSFSQNLKNDSESCLCDPGNCSSTPCFFFFFFDRTKPRSLSLSLAGILAVGGLVPMLLL